MSLNARLSLLLMLITAGFSQSLFAEIVTLERRDDVTLTTVTDSVYQRHPAQDNDLVMQQKINANNDLANAFLAKDTTVNLSHFNDAVGSNGGFQEWEANLGMPLWLPGQKQKQLALSDKLSAEIPAYKQQIRLQASGKVRDLIWAVALAETRSKQAWQAWQTALKLEDDVNSRVKAGELAKIKLLLANTNRLELHSKYLEMVSELEHAISSYQHITGEQYLPSQYQETLPELVLEHHSEIVVSQQHPSILILDQQISTLYAQRDLAKFEGTINPNLSLGVRHEKAFRGESFVDSIGLGISFPLNSKVYRQPAIANASQALADALIVRQQLERKLNITLFSVLHDIEAKKQQLELMTQKDATTQHYFTLQKRSFDLGETSLMTLLQSQTLANESTSRKKVLEVEIQQMIAALNQAMGHTL